MRKVILFLLFSLLTDVSCETAKENDNQVSKSTVRKIEFQRKVTNEQDLEIFEDGIIPWISIENPEVEFEDLLDADEIVLSQQKVTVLIDYPLESPVEFAIESGNPRGFSRKELAKSISQIYRQIYKEEEESTQTKVVPLSERQNLYNRNKTNGKYGIWGHDIGDLDLELIEVVELTDGKIRLELSVVS